MITATSDDQADSKNTHIMTTATATPTPADQADSKNLIPQFDIVTDDSDHHYQKTYVISPQVNKKIMREWRILQDNLPDSIYVRVYEKRLDILRAMIKGAAGTPYHNGLFFFDIFFQEGYPACPPKVNYRSYGYRLNPNLYANGIVCLSLLNTWRGAACERWDPDQSTILQVLLSIQALVLNDDPFFNEPGYGKTSKNIVMAKKYFEYAYLKSLKTMKCVIHKQPKNFEAIIKEHFKDKSVEILTDYAEYSRTVRVENENQLTDYIKDFIRELTKIEALPDGFEISVGKIKKNKKNKKRNGSSGVRFVKMVFGKMKKFFGMKQINKK